MPVKKTKITLSDKELELVNNTDWILTKKIIIRKVYALFEEAAITMQSILYKSKNVLPETVTCLQPKITRGENYLNLPYVVLDYPGFFTKKNSFAIRTIFWWGNFFSIQLLTSGIFKEHVSDELNNRFLHLKEKEYYLCISEDRWQHHFDMTNYVPLSDLQENEYRKILDTKPFIQIGKKIPLDKWDTVPFFVEQSFAELIMLLGTSYPNDGTDLSPDIPITGSGL